MTLLRRSLDCEVRAIDEEKRECTFVAATENPVRTWGGVEVLRIKGCQLGRYKRNPVVLDSHRMESVRDIVGSAVVEKDGDKLTARIRFDDDEHSEMVWRKVRSGSLRALSIGYTIDRSKVRELREGETDGDVTGPATVVRGWELHEVSVVPVPADADALRRSATKEGRMASQDEPHAGGGQQAPAPAPVINLEAERLKREAETARARIALREVHHAEIRSFCPESLRGFLDGLLIEDPDMTVESARRALVDERKRTHKPVGTPEPGQPPVTTGAQPAPTPIDWEQRLSPLCG